MEHAKKTKKGQEERLALLRRVFGVAVDNAVSDRRRLGCAVDDILDALVGLWTARRIYRGDAITLPSIPPKDRFDLPMEMVA
jgi:predicted RNase H-like nuclease